MLRWNGVSADYEEILLYNSPAIDTKEIYVLK